MSKKQAGYAVFELVFVLLVVIGAGGWIANIVKLVGMSLEHITVMLIFRVGGIFVPPLGAMMGFL